MADEYFKAVDNMFDVGSAAREIDPNAEPPATGLSDAEISFLRLVARNSAYTIKPKNYSLLNGVFPPHPLSPLSIATVSTSLLYTGEPAAGRSLAQGASHFKPITRSGGRYQLFSLDDVLSVDNMKAFLQNAILDTAQKLRAFESKTIAAERLDDTKRLIIVNEFGFPFPLELPDRQAFLADLEDRMAQDTKMRSFWQSCYLVFGSYHCHSEMKNSAVISLPYYPRLTGEHGADPTEFAKRQIGYGRSETGGRYNFTQDKFSPAESIGEHLVPRAKIDWAFYDTDMGRIGVLICFDALDPRMLLRLVLLQRNDTNSDTSRFSAIVVPCFSPNDTVAESCLLISKMLNTLVVYVNAQYIGRAEDSFGPPTPDHPRPTSHAYYYCGQEITAESEIEGIHPSAMEASTLVDREKNLWYSTRFCHIDRQALHDRSLHKTPFSSTFAEIFASTKLDNADPEVQPPRGQA